ncbi:MAG: hypothetical protein QGG54_18880, partial [Gammaproteobacteria bacterium]|nr:hypothetical protein [Gammaproteobacteria bacterium]
SRNPFGFSPAWLCVWFHRLSHYCYHRRWNRLSRIFWQLNVMVTGADINPSSDLGAGLVIPYPAGISIHASSGRNLTVMGLCAISGGLSEIPGMPGPQGRPLLGDDVYLSYHSGAYGPVRIGNHVRLDPGCYVSEDVPDDTRMVGPRNKAQQMRRF